MADIFEVIQKIYHSANSKIYRAKNSSADTEVVIKLLNRVNPTPIEIGRFKNEFKLAQKIDHPNIISVFHIDTFENAPTIVMEDFGGESLYRIWNSNKLHLEKKLHICCLIAAGIEAIHNNNIIHKDINPSNIVWCPRLDVVKIIDFGISTELAEETTNTIQNHAMWEGTLAFMAPEQTGRMNRSVDYRCDLYSFGVTLYWLFTGQLPFNEIDPLKLIHAHIAIAPDNPCHINKKLPGTIGRIILKLMAKDADDRYQSITSAKHDLERCRKNLKLQGMVNTFAIGKTDTPSRFQLPKKLFGRDTEIDALFSAFDRVCATGRPEITLISGHSGVGKTMLVGEINRKIVEKNGLLLTGKSNQMESAIPHESIIQALCELFDHLLSEPKKYLDDLKNKINKAIYPNGKVITDVISNAELVIGQQPDLIELPPLESENRFNSILLNLLAVFARQDHPLVIFFDDLQWSNASTCNLIKGLLTSQVKHTYVIGAYRDNEISDNYPLQELIQKLKEYELKLQKIDLAPLTENDVKKFVQETLKFHNLNTAAELAELCYLKTNGNAFHLVQLLVDLNANGAFTICQENNGWLWNKEKTIQLKLLDDIVVFMMSKIKRLSPKAQEAVFIAACIDNNFSLEKIKTACGHDTNTMYALLSEAVRQGLIVASENYKYSDAISDGLNIHFRFLHDRIRQAAYELVSVQDRNKYHMAIGKRLLKQLEQKSSSVNVFDVVKQLNHVTGKLTDTSERLTLVRLNMRAGQEAKASTAWRQAFEYFQISLSLLKHDDWKLYHDIVFTLHVNTAETACLTSDFDTVDSITNLAMGEAKTILEKCALWEIQINAFVSKGLPIEATEYGISILAHLGIKIQPDLYRITFIIAVFKAKYSLGKIKQELARSMTDPTMAAASKILMKIATSAYLTGKEAFLSVILNSIELIKKYGYYVDTAFGLVSFAGFLCVIHDYRTAAQFADLALQVSEKDDSKPIRAKVIYLASAFTRVWKQSYKSIAPDLLHGFSIGIETGDLEYAAFNIYCHFYLRFLSGEPLAAVEADMAEHENKIKTQDTVWNFFRLYHQLIINLQGNAENPIQLKGKSCDEENIIKHFKAHGNQVGLFDIYTKKLMLAVLLYQYEKAEKISTNVDYYINAALAKHDLPIALLYQSLLFIESLKNSKQDAAAKMKLLSKNIRKMKKWAHHAPANYQHKYLLLLAEVKSIAGKGEQAEKYYRQAIASAEQNGIMHETALCHERLALYYKVQGNLSDYKRYIMASFNEYKNWGGVAKCLAMKMRYPEVFSTDLHHAAKTVRTSGLTAMPFKTTTETTELSNMDLLSIIRASQVISKEMDINRLSDKLLEITIVNAGAQKGILFIQNQEGEFIIQAIKNGNKLKNDSYPKTVINYTVRTNKIVLLENAACENTFENDAYIKKNKVKSLLCIPLARKNKPYAALYLENNQTSKAFTKDRVLLLRTIISQASIYVENAQLYTKVAKSEERYRSIFENAMDGIFQSTPEGKLITANRALAKMLGYASPDQMIRAIQNLLVNSYVDSIQRETFKQTMQTRGFIKNFEAELQKKNGIDSITGILSVYAVRDQNGKILYYEGMLKDITERKQMEALRIDKEAAEVKASTKSRFLAHMSHEIRTPINTILGYAEILRDATSECHIPDKEQFVDYIDTIMSSGQHLISLIDEILEFLKLETGKAIVKNEKVCIASMISYLDNEFRNKIESKGLVYNIHTDLDGCIMTDKTRLKQILINLIDNAYKYTQTGFIHVSVISKPKTDKYIDIIWRIEDSGIGMADTESIFEEFEQLNRNICNGAGLGLAIVKKLVALMGGELDVESTLGKGSSFKVSFRDVEVVKQKKSVKRENRVNVDFYPATLVVADDNPKNRKLIIDYLRNQKIKIIEAEDGESAINALKNSVVDLILMDLKMPSIDGHQATKIIKANSALKSIPVIALTADVTEESRNKALTCGCDGFLLKPISRVTLFTEMKRFLKHRVVKTSVLKKDLKGGDIIKLDFDVKEQRGLINALKIVEQKRQKIINSMIIGDIECFADEIVSVGLQFRSDAIANWGRKLRTHASNFKKSEMEAMMQKYPAIVEMIEKGYQLKNKGA